MHPTRAASILAVIGAVLLAAVLVLRAIALWQALALAAQGNGPAARPLPAVGGYRISEDGSQVLFLQSPVESPEASSSWWTMPVDGGLPVRAEAPENELAPFQIHDGLVFLLVDGGENLRQISPAGETVVSAARSPDGRSLAFSTLLRSGRWRLYTVDDETRLSWLGEEDAYIDVEWSPDGRRLAFIAPRGGFDQLFTILTGGQDYRQLTSDPSRKSRPRWSPDGASIAYLAVSGGDRAMTIGSATPSPIPLVIRSTVSPGLGAASSNPGRIDLFLIPAGGGVARQVTNSPQSEESPAWAQSSRGSELTYALRQEKAAHAAYLYGFDPQTGATRRIYPPLSLDAITCPRSIPFGGAADAHITMTNSALVPLDMPLALSADDRPVGFAGIRAVADVIETITLLPGETRDLAWQAPASPGRRTHITTAALIEDPFPIDGLHCSTVNTLILGLPNLPLLAVSIPAALAGMLLCLPHLLQRKKGALWALWLAAPLASLGWALMELAISR